MVDYRRRQDRGATVAAVRSAETQSTRHRALAAALRSIVSGYRAIDGLAIDADTIGKAHGGDNADRLTAAIDADRNAAQPSRLCVRSG